LAGGGGGLLGGGAGGGKDGGVVSDMGTNGFFCDSVDEGDLFPDVSGGLAPVPVDGYKPEVGWDGGSMICAGGEVSTGKLSSFCKFPKLTDVLAPDDPVDFGDSVSVTLGLIGVTGPIKDPTGSFAEVISLATCFRIDST